MARILYISYDGLLEPLGQSQIWQYLRLLAKDQQITLVTYEKKRDWSDPVTRATLRLEVRRAGIEWIPFRYHKWPTGPATAYDLLVGFFVCSYLVWVRHIQIVHARSYMPSVLALILKGLFGIGFLFDMRGLWADERVDAGLWRQNSRGYRLAKYFEKQFLQTADTAVVLTHVGAEEIKKFHRLKKRAPKLEVIRTCVNLELFRPLTSRGKNRVEFFAKMFRNPVFKCFGTCLSEKYLCLNITEKTFNAF